MRGLVVKNTGSWYIVRTEDGQLVQCKVKGNFRLKGIRTTNPVAIGDRVVLDDSNPKSQTSKLNSYFITEIEDRRNYIIRRSQHLSKQSHILAANVDQALLLVTVNRPQTSTTFIDRFLASAEAYRVPVVPICAATGEGVEELRPLLDGQVTLLSGNSGVGKSTLINRLVPTVNLRTAEISDAHNTGQHTTTFSEMIPLASNPSPQNSNPSYLIDTPGIKGFGTFDIEPEELTSYFREIFHFSKDCRFSNCTHTHEPGCAVLRALEDHYIAQSRYQSYLSMLDDKDGAKYREAY